MNLYKEFEKLALENKSSEAIYDIDKKETISYFNLYQKVNEYEKMISNFNEKSKIEMIVIYLEKGIDLIAWQLTASKVSVPFINIEEEVRLNQLKENLNHFVLITDGKVEEIKTDKQQNNNNNKQEQSLEQQKLKLKLNKLEKAGYVIFTSGSTGKPKQIYLRDDGIVSVVKEQARVLDFNNGCRFLWLLNRTFDASLSDIYVPLLSGGCLFTTNIKPNKVKTVFEFIQTYDITHTDLPPVTLPLYFKQNIKNNGKIDNSKLLKTNKKPKLLKVIIGGELVNENAIKDFILTENQLIEFDFYNAYGPSENTICTFLGKVEFKLGLKLKLNGERIKNETLSLELDRISDYFDDETKNLLINGNNLFKENLLVDNIALKNNGIKYGLRKIEDLNLNHNQNDENLFNNVVYELLISGNTMIGYDNPELNKKKLTYCVDKNYYFNLTFKSGDLVIIKKNTINGLNYLAYIGRLDRQFKYNGKLISPEEIEKIAMSCGYDNNIENAVLKLTEDNKLKLMVYIKETKQDKKFNEELFNQKLPTYMKPVMVEIIESRFSENFENITQEDLNKVLNNNWKIRKN